MASQTQTSVDLPISFSPLHMPIETVIDAKQGLGTYEFFGMPKPAHFRYGKKDFVDGPSKKYISELYGIIRDNDIEKLRIFRQMHPEITLSSTCITDHPYGGPFREMPLDALTYSQLDDANVQTSEFIDELFALGYIKPDDVYILCEVLYGLGDYKKWDNAIQIFKKLDKNIMANTYYKCTSEESLKQESFIDDIVGNFYQCHVTHYFGKIHGKAAEFFQLLEENGIKRHYIEGDDETIEAERKFWDIPSSVKYFQEDNPELFATRNIAYWNTL
jgi:hypothetical protein